MTLPTNFDRLAGIERALRDIENDVGMAEIHMINSQEALGSILYNQTSLPGVLEKLVSIREDVDYALEVCRQHTMAED